MLNYEAISSPLLFNAHEITGLSPNTQYVVVMYLLDRCGIGTTTTVLVETRSLTSELHHRSIGLAGVLENPIYTYTFDSCFIYFGIINSDFLGIPSAYIHLLRAAYVRICVTLLWQWAD